MNAVLSATATSSVGTSRPRWARRSPSPAANACAMERMVRPASSRSRSESSGTSAPSTNTMRRASTSASVASAALARAFAAASGKPASGFASRMSARRSVYFHSSTRRCGRPSVSKRRNASSRSTPTVGGPGSARLTAAKLVASAVSAAVLIGRTSAFIASSRHLFLVLRVAGRLEVERQLLVAGLHDAAARKHVHHVRHDVVEQPLVVRDHDEAARGRAQRIDAVGNGLERVDVEAGVGLVEHAQPRLQQRHLQDLVALLLAAGEADIDPAPQHLLLDAEPARDLAHARKRRFARAVRSHERMHAAGADRKLEPVEDFLAVDLDVQVLHFQQMHLYPTLPSRLIEISFCASTANSIGSCCSTSLTKTLTMSATASSSERPRCMQ